VVKSGGIASGKRVDWVDYAKGFCIVMVVTMHTVLGVEKATGQTNWMDFVVAFALPFRMPDFFLISGLFLARVIDRDWRDYLDRKVVHFAYFYALWVTINFILRGPGMYAEGGADLVIREYLLSFIEPFGTMWFIYLLPLFFVTAKLTRRFPWQLVWLAGAILQIAPVQTGWTIPDEFAERFVFFYTGYVFAPEIFRFAGAAMQRPGIAGAYLAAWALVNGGLVAAGIAMAPGIGLALGFLGAVAVIMLATLLTRIRVFDALRYCGEHSLVVYLAFILFMGPARVVLLRAGIIPDDGVLSLIVIALSVAGSIALYWAVRNTPLRFLFERPRLARIERAPSLVPAE
jgi:uncharacterized membrane protein YcfT